MHSSFWLVLVLFQPMPHPPMQCRVQTLKFDHWGSISQKIMRVKCENGCNFQVLENWNLLLDQEQLIANKDLWSLRSSKNLHLQFVYNFRFAETSKTFTSKPRTVVLRLAKKKQKKKKKTVATKNHGHILDFQKSQSKDNSDLLFQSLRVLKKFECIEQTWH